MSTAKHIEEGGAKAALRAKGYVPAVEAAEKLGFTTQTLYDWMDADVVHGIRLGKGRWVEWASIVSYFKKKDPEAAKLAGIS
jgi:hypothetical protein